MSGWEFSDWDVKCLSTDKYHHEIHPGSYAGGAFSEDAGAPAAANYCTKYGAGTGVTIEKSRAITWSNGFSFGYGGFGVNLSAETGYDSSGALDYHNGSSGTRYFCGTGGYLANTPYVVVAKTSS